MTKILLVEDTLHLSEEIADVLRMEGFEVTMAHNGQDGLVSLMTSLPNLIITDLLMPKMDGFEFIQKLRAIPSSQTIPVIILSAKISEADKLRGKETGADAFVQKPCKAHELIEAINGLVNKEGVLRSR